MKKHLLLTLTGALVLMTAGAQTFTGPKTIYNIDATDSTKYTYYSLKNAQAVNASDSATDKWDIAFCKSRLIFNNGVSGPGKVMAQVVDAAWPTVKTAPATGYTVDGDSTKVLATGSGRGWYWYNKSTKVVKPVRNRTIALSWPDGSFAKLEIVSYLKNASRIQNDSMGYYCFRYLLSKNNNLSQHIDTIRNLDANSEKLLRLSSESLIDSTKKSGSDWDVSFKATDIVVNSGAEFGGKTIGQTIEVDFDTLLIAPDGNYKQSTEAVPGGTDNGWYHYDFLLTHTVNPIAKRTLVFQDKYGRYAKMEITNYYKDAPANPTLLNTSGWYKLDYFYQPDGSGNLDPEYVGPFIAEPADTISNVDPENPNDTTGTGNPTDPTDTTGTGGTGIFHNSPSNNSFGLYPNPSISGTFGLTLNAAEAVVSVNIVNLEGKRVYSATPSEITTRNFNTNLPTGLYIVAINTASTTYLQKLVVQ